MCILSFHRCGGDIVGNDIDPGFWSLSVFPVSLCLSGLSLLSLMSLSFAVSLSIFSLRFHSLVDLDDLADGTPSTAPLCLRTTLNKETSISECIE